MGFPVHVVVVVDGTMPEWGGNDGRQAWHTSVQRSALEGHPAPFSSEYIKIDVEIGVNQAVAHADHVVPWDAGGLITHVWRYLVGRL
ncbi:MAG: hypothetical protein OET79_12775, partial [Nitrospirota bacterium]|nr:hypothetical protein [Nitrospirota bacterium]